MTTILYFLNIILLIVRNILLEDKIPKMESFKLEARTAYLQSSSYGKCLQCMDACNELNDMFTDCRNKTMKKLGTVNYLHLRQSLLKQLKCLKKIICPG